MASERKRKRWKKVLLCAACVVAVLILVNQITVCPFIWAFRGIMSLAGRQGNSGSYTDAIARAEEVDRVTVPVEGYPDAAFTVYRPRHDQSSLPVIVYIHGGGWSMGNAESISWFARLLASEGYVVCNVDYALAPENPYPASTYQLAAVVNYVYEHADDFLVDRDRIFIGGNSAGAHLSSQLGALFTGSAYADQVGVDIRVPGEAIRGLLLFNGVYDFDTAEDCGFFAFRKWVWSYTGRKNYKAYERLDEMSTVKHVSTKYPAAFITVGDADPLEPQTTEFVEVLVRNGIDHTALFWTGTGMKLDHDYIYELNTAQAQEALGMVIGFLAEHSR